MKEYKINGKTYKIVVESNIGIETFKTGGKVIKKTGLVVGFQSGGKSVKYKGVKYLYDEKADKFYTESGKEASIPGYVKDSLIKAAVPIKEISSTSSLDVADDVELFNLKSSNPKVSAAASISSTKSIKDSVEDGGTIFKLPGDKTYTYMKRGNDFLYFNNKSGTWNQITNVKAISRLNNFTRGTIENAAPSTELDVESTDVNSPKTTEVKGTKLNELRWEGYDKEIQAVRTENANAELARQNYMKEQAALENNPNYAAKEAEAIKQDKQRRVKEAEKAIRDKRIRSFGNATGVVGGKSPQQEKALNEKEYNEVQKIKNEQGITYDEAKKLYEEKDLAIRNIQNELEGKLRNQGVKAQDLNFDETRKQAEEIYNSKTISANRNKNLLFNFKYGGKTMARRKKYGKGGTVQELRNKLYKK